MTSSPSCSRSEARVPPRVDGGSASTYRSTRVVRLLTASILASILLPRMAAAEPSRCEGCHEETMQRADHQGLLERHAGQACTACHGGDASADQAKTAHVSAGPESLLPRAHTVASCARCHLPGAVPGTEALVAGARTFQDLGCPFCHHAGGYGSTEAWSPSLEVIGLRGPEHLKRALNTPYQLFRDTRMPSFTVKWKREPERESTLISYLLTFRGGPRPRGRVSVHEPCAVCHGVSGVDRSRIDGHRCLELADPKKELDCQRCHPKGPPRSERECLYVRQRRLDCGACHMGERDEARSP